MNVQSFDQLLQNAGMGITGDQYVEEYFSKALGTNNSGAGGHQSGPLMLENLDAMMTEVLITEQHFKLFNALPKVPSSQPYYEYNVRKGFGSNRAGGAGFRQGGAPKGGVSAFERKGIYNKYAGVKGGVTHQMIMAGQNGGAFVDPVVQENRDRTLELLEKVERETVFGQKAIKDENGEEVNYDGLLTQLAADFAANVIDMKGAPLDFAQLDLAAKDLITTGKQPTVNGYTAMASTHVLDGLNQQFASRNMQRFNKDVATGQQYTPGTVLNKYDTQFGTFAFDYSILFNEVEGGVPNAAAPSGAPSTPAITTQPAAADDAAGQHLVDTYYYSIAAFNDTGESLPVVTDPIAVTDATTKVTIVVTRKDGATGYRIYRGLLADGSDAKWIAKVAQPANGNLTFVDKGENYTLDANGKESDGLCILYKPDPRDLVVAQMSPLMKMPLPIEGTTFPFLLLLYMVPVIKAPERIKIFKNCGTYAPA
jgi:hypothetical protein